MHQIDNSSAVTPMPTPGAVGPNPNYFFAFGTKPTHDFMNALMMEICNVITGAGLALDKTDQNQLYDAIILLISSYSASLNADLDVNGHAITSTAGIDIDLSPSSGNVNANSPLNIQSILAYLADATNNITFTAGTQTFKIGGTPVMNVTASGLQLLSGARVTQIDNDATMAANSATRLATQAATMAYIDSKLNNPIISFSGFTETVMAATETWYFSQGVAVNSAPSGGSSYSVSFVAPYAGTLSDLQVFSLTAPGIAATYTFTVFIENAASSITCAIAGAAFSSNDLSNSESISAGDRIHVRVAISATATSTSRLSFALALAP